MQAYLLVTGFVHNFALFIVGAGIAVWAVRLFSALRSRSP